MHKKLKEEKRIFDKILLDYKPSYDIVKSKDYVSKYDFMEEYKKNDNQSRRIILAMTIIYDESQLAEKYPGIDLPGKLYEYLCMNLLMYYVLIFTKSIKINVCEFVKSELNSDNKNMKMIRCRIEERFGMGRMATPFKKKEIPKNVCMFFFPALRWFYSEGTKHLYSGGLIGEMREYEKKIKNIKWEDCIEEKDKYFRLRF